MAIFGKFTEQGHATLSYAEEEARHLKHHYVGSEHILLGLLRLDHNLLSEIFNTYDITYDKTLAKIIHLMGKGSEEKDFMGYTPRTKKILELGLLEARNTGETYIGPEHILLGILGEGEGIAYRILLLLNADPVSIQETLLDTLDSYSVNPLPDSTSDKHTVSHKQKPKVQTKNLDLYGDDLTAKAKQHLLDPVIGREAEIQRTMQTLCRRRKNNPCLIGEPGVGKTAIVEGLANIIAGGNIPEHLADKRLVSLELSSMVAGAKYRGEFEDRVKKVLNEIKKAKNIILFVDELHTIINAGAAEGAIDAANIFKPFLARGDLQMIGATTLDEYKKYIEKDAALERRFQPIQVEEPSPEDSLEILKGLRPYYEDHHKVTITDATLEAAVTLSDRYLTDRFLPDKAIDLIDEASAKQGILRDTPPQEAFEIKKHIRELNKAREDALYEQDYEKAILIKSEIQDLKASLAEYEYQGEELVINPHHISDVITQWTGIPASTIEETEADRLLHLEERLSEYIIGQEIGISTLAKSIRRSRLGLQDPGKPIGSFIFSGPSGVGKTALCKALAKVVFGRENAVIRLDMSEYMEKHSMSQLIGSPPGYVGFEDGGQLTERVRRHPYSVILFDEIEKAHQNIFNLLLQILDEGHITDSRGRHVDFKNTLIIMTSNIGSRSIMGNKEVLGFNAGKDADRKSYEKMKDTVNRALKDTFKPEFLNRVGEVIIFENLNREQLVKIAGMMVKTLTERLKKMNISLAVDNSLNPWIVSQMKDTDQGARPIFSVLREKIEDPLAEFILREEINCTDEHPCILRVDIAKDHLIFTEEKELSLTT
jgi:ATP-dependent Clp protease ATP-binding subunit ClpC